ncbi:MAG: Glu/Leu/Phe/Val dehydrogenase [bacterium]|nr:Glu/Leu/Phe/Val dehydrogenase [bacterium]
MTSLLASKPEVLANELLAAGSPRAMLLGGQEAGRTLASSPDIECLAEFLASDARDARNHEAVFLAVGPESRALFGVFIHCTARGQAQGGVRNWHYESVEDFLRDGLRLAVGMGRKCALADLWWGGGKGIICASEPTLGRDQRRTVFREFAQFVTSLRGVYVTAEDAGTTPHDMEVIHCHTRFATCIPQRVGGSGNPSSMTARGVIRAMEAALDHEGRGTLEGKQIAMQGAGNVGSFMIEALFEAGAARVVASEISNERCTELSKRFPSHFLEVRRAEPGDATILEEPCDILCPNALGGVLDAKSIEKIRAPIVCGAANNALADESADAARMLERRITYVPDYVANRMGIVACSNEQAGSLPDDPFVLRHLEGPGGWANSIFNTTQEILSRARDEAISTTRAAQALAEERARIPHPIWGHRAREITLALWHEGWAQGRDSDSR